MYGIFSYMNGPMDPMEWGLFLPVACDDFSRSPSVDFGAGSCSVAWKVSLWGKLTMKLVSNCSSQIKAQRIHDKPWGMLNWHPLKPFGTLWKVHWLYLIIYRKTHISCWFISLLSRNHGSGKSVPPREELPSNWGNVSLPWLWEKG